MRFKTGIIIILIALIIVILNLANFSGSVKSFFYSISSPIQKFFWQAGNNTSDFFEVFFNGSGLKRENEELKIQNQELAGKLIKLNELENENVVLRKALDIGLPKDFRLAFAQIIGKDVAGDFITIDNGSKDGISMGMPVITEQKVLVGRISEVGDNYSKVMLLSNKETSIDAKISGSEIYGVLRGRGKTKISFELVPPDKELKSSDLLTTAALGGVFPEGLLIGEVREVKKLDVEPFQSAEIKAAVNINDLEALFIITGNL